MGTPLVTRIRPLRLALLFAGLAAAGCVTAPPELPPEPPPPDPIVVLPPEPVAEPEPEPEPEPPPPTTLPAPKVAVLLSNRSPAYESVAVALGAQFDDLSIYDLTDKSQPPESAFRRINDSDTTAVVAIGPGAAQSAVSLSRVPVIFTQVFNHQDFGLVTEVSRGISAVPPLAAQLGAWQDVDPGVSRVGLIIGPGHEDLIVEAEIAAADRGIEIDVQVVGSDQETLYHFKRMVSNLDGFWLLPDNRILSARVLRTIFDDARRREVSVLVPTEALLALGATLSVESVPENIAETIKTIVHDAQLGRFADVPPISPLSAIRVTINEALLNPPVALEASEREAEPLR